jgi:hypothetical protein
MDGTTNRVHNSPPSFPLPLLESPAVSGRGAAWLVPGLLSLSLRTTPPSRPRSCFPVHCSKRHARKHAHMSGTAPVRSFQLGRNRRRRSRLAVAVAVCRDPLFLRAPVDAASSAIGPLICFAVEANAAVLASGASASGSKRTREQIVSFHSVL